MLSTLLSSATTLLVSLAISLGGSPPYWPGPPGIPTDNTPKYPDTIYVIDTLGVNDAKARPEWNHCGSVQLVHGPLSMREQPGTITILPGIDELPRGGWTGDHGVLLLPPGSWTRSVPIIRHELGHALGFGHTTLWSVMGSSNHVQPIDCRGLIHYYGRG